jgi:hypothetical protein
MVRASLTLGAAALVWFLLAGSGTAQIAMPAAPPKVGWLVYRNDSPISVLVQASIMGPNNQERRGAPHQMNPREAAWDQVSTPGPKTITIYDSNGKVIFRDSINYVGKDLFFSIQAEVTVKGKEKIVKGKLVPLADPRGFSPVMMPPGFTPAPVMPAPPKK